jgi:hypothetical protein
LLVSPIGDGAEPRIPGAPGKPERFDYEYERNGTANVFMFCEPMAGRRRVAVTDRRTKCDWGEQVRTLLDVQYPRADRVTLVMDNLNTHAGIAVRGIRTV